MKKTIKLTPVMDTFIDSSLPDQNSNSKEYYFLGLFKLATKYRVLMKFDLTEIPQNAFIEKAVLELFCTRNDYLEQENNFEIRPIINDWNASEASYNNQPQYDDKRSITMTAGFSVYENINTDITEFVTQWRDHPDSNHGFIIKAANETDIETLLTLYSDRHEYAEWKPYLKLTLDIPEPVIQIRKKNKKVAIATPQFLFWNGDGSVFGGGERYLLELAQLIMDMGYQVDVFQPSSGEPWERVYDGFRVFGVGNAGFEDDFFIALNEKFYDLTKDYDLHIYLSMDLTFPHVFPNSICVSHGVWWDSKERPWWRSEKWYQRLFDGLDLIKTLVSVDTNTINWLNAVNPDVKCEKILVPNYADLNIFKPDGPSLFQNKKPITVLYPRRLVAGRGWCVTKEIAKELTAERDDISFSFVGRGTKECESHMEIFVSHYPRTQYCWYEPQDMYLAYKNADIVLIPSYYSEGTSFSLLEAMACGKPVIAGLVGGLTDLVIDGYNGLLIQVSKESLKDAVVKLANNKNLREQMGKNSYAMAQSFSKRLWEQRWKTILNNHL